MAGPDSDSASKLAELKELNIVDALSTLLLLLLF